jgi:HlyD family secretion protein
MNPNKFFIKVLFFATLVPALLLTGCANGSATASSTSTGTVASINTVDTIETSGSLSADQLSALAWGTSGIVEKVNVQVGQTVKAGDVLATLKLESVPADILTAQADLSTAQRALQEVLDSQSALAAAQLAVANAQSAVDTAQKTVDSLDRVRVSQDVINNAEQKISQANRSIKMAAERYRKVQHKLDTDPKKIEAELALTNAQENVDTIVAEYNWYTGTATATDAALTRATLASAQASLATAQKDYEILQKGADPVDVAAAQAKVATAQAAVNKMVLIAPFDGVILTTQTVPGNVVNSGDAAVEMVNRNTLKIDALVDETSISSVTVGDKANITMDLLPDVTLTGKVTIVNSIGTTVNGLVKYTVTIALDPTDQPVRFGATANIVLYTSEPHAALTVPVSAIQSDSQGEYVTLIKANGSTERIAIVSGELANGQATITASGLQAGDQIALGATSTASTTSSNSSNNSAGSPPGGGLMPIGGPGGN